MSEEVKGGNPPAEGNPIDSEKISIDEDMVKEILKEVIREEYKNALSSLKKKLGGKVQRSSNHGVI